MSDLIDKRQPILIYSDNQGAIKLATNHVFHNRTKHIDIRALFVREAVESKKIYLEYMPTQ
jgi:hypothetical protein